MTTVLYDVRTRGILVIDPERDEQGDPILPTGVDVAVAEVSTAEAAKFVQEGTFTLGSDGQTVIVAAAPADPTIAVSVERIAAGTDLEVQYQTAIARLDQIIAATAPTNAQVIAAVRDMATYERKVMRFLHARYVSETP